MKRPTFKEKIFMKKGESLVESVVSILVFSILMLAITSIIGASINITKKANVTGKDWQENTVNRVISENYSKSKEVEIEFEFRGESGKVVTRRWINYNNGEDGILAFYPAEDPNMRP